MIDDNTKRDIKRHLLSAGFDATVVDELVCERKRLRDEFAMAAMVARVQRGYGDPDAMADACYYDADAMMARRKQ